MSSRPLGESDTKNFYSRKDKSLGVLCSNFLMLYNRDGVDSIGLDDAASRLGVERRRIYDIVNILESVGVLSRKAKNQYSWKGLSAIPGALDELKDEAEGENFSTSICCKYMNVANENESTGLLKSKIDRQNKPDNRKEKSLGLLTQNFVKLFLCSDVDVISLDNAATELLGDIHDPTTMRTKVRRLYDIANVLSSMNLIQKTPHPGSGKPAFRWLGTKGSSKKGTATPLDLNESKKRMFGTEITNTSSKRYKADSSIDWNSNQKTNMPIHMKYNDSKEKHKRNSLDQDQKHHSKDFVFGPFTPAILPRVEGSGNKNVKQSQDWENMASYRPQYCNKGCVDQDEPSSSSLVTLINTPVFLKDFKAWKSWYVEASEKKQIQVS